MSITLSDDNPDAAQALKDDIEAKTSGLPDNPHIYRIGRVSGTREMVMPPNYIVVYAENATAVTILRVLHSAQQWPQAEGHQTERVKRV